VISAFNDCLLDLADYTPLCEPCKPHLCIYCIGVQFSGVNQKILVVDDEQSITDLLEDNLRQNGYRVAAARDSREVLRLARTEQLAGVWRKSVLGNLAFSTPH
jgi:hypothetical protein